MSPQEAWGVTFGEFWPLYNAIVGRQTKPMSASEFKDLHEAWGKGELNGNT